MSKWQLFFICMHIHPYFTNCNSPKPNNFVIRALVVTDFQQSTHGYWSNNLLNHKQFLQFISDNIQCYCILTELQIYFCLGKKYIKQFKITFYYNVGRRITNLKKNMCSFHYLSHWPLILFCFILCLQPCNFLLDYSILFCIEDSVTLSVTCFKI